MRIMTCSQCGRSVHEAKKCFHCGSEGLYLVDFDSSVPADAASAYGKIHEKLEKRSFSEVMSLSQGLRKWMSSSAEVYWMRLLAKHECATDLELIVRGVDLDEDEDYCNATKYASPEEYRVYLDVQEKMDRVRMELGSALRKHYAAKMRELDPAKKLEALDEEVGKQEEGLMKQWAALVEAEQDIRKLEMDARLASAEVKQTLQQALKLSREAAEEARKDDKCSESVRQSRLISATTALQMSEEAAAAAKAMRENHPWLAQMQTLQEKRDALAEAIEQDRARLKECNDQGRLLLNKLRTLELQREDALQSVRKDSFVKARQILEDAWAQVLRDAEVTV